MFNPFKKQPTGTTIKLNIDGMHCTSCSMNIDGELEDLDGVISAETSYAKSISIVHYDETKVSPKEIRAVIEDLGYSVQPS